MLTALLALADPTGDLDWVASIDSTVVRVRQHGGGARRDSVSGLQTRRSCDRALP